MINWYLPKSKGNWLVQKTGDGQPQFSVNCSEMQADSVNGKSCYSKNVITMPV